MRPKTVVIIFLVAIAGVAAILFLKGLGSSDQEGVVAPIETTEVPVAASNSAPVAVEPPKVEAITHEDERTAKIEKEVDQVNDAVARGSGDPISLVKITDRLTHPEKEVREAAIRAARLLGDRAAIKNLKLAKDQLEDPREKSAIMDVIEYLEMDREGEGVFAHDTNTPPDAAGLGSQPGPGSTPGNPVPKK